MANQGENNIKLGVFVLTGLFVLVLSFYLIGKNHNLFGSDFKIRVRFENLNGLAEGNNVLFAGLQAGTVKTINMINDTTIEVTLLIGNKIRPFIRKNAIAAIGTEGLMGNKIVNIMPSRSASQPVAEGDVLATQKMVSTDAMLQTLSKTNNNVALIAEALKGTVLKINGSALMDLLNDQRIGASLRSSLGHIDKAAVGAMRVTAGLDELVAGIKKGKGPAGILLSDTVAAANLQVAIFKIKKASANADEITAQLNELVQTLNHGLNKGNGSLQVLLRDSAFARDLKVTMGNLEQGTEGFNQNMEALKHNFLFRGYFKNQEKEKAKQTKQGGKP